MQFITQRTEGWSAMQASLLASRRQHSVQTQPAEEQGKRGKKAAHQRKRPLAAQCGFHLFPQRDEDDKGRRGRKLGLCRAIGGDGLRFGGRVHQECKIASTTYRLECYRKVDRARRRLLQIGEL